MKKRKHFLNLVTFAVAAVLTCGVTSCGDDDDDTIDPSPSPTPGVSYIPSPVITDINGNMLRVMSVDERRFTYSESGKLASIGNCVLQDDKFSFSYKGKNYDIYLNSDGLIATIHSTEGSDPSGKTHSYVEQTTKISYSNHRLKSCSFSGKLIEDKGRETSDFTGKISYTWKGGNLVEAKYEDKSIEKSEKESFIESWTCTTTFTYGTQSNPCKQFPFYMGWSNYITGDALAGVLSVLGLLGYGPENLPTGYTETILGIADGEVYKNETYNYKLSFTLNDNGTFKSESRDTRVCDYTYSNASSN